MANYSSSPTSLSSPPGSISDPGSPSRQNQGRANIAMGDEIIVDTAARFRLMQQPPPPTTDVPLTAAGVPRKKPGRKPGAAAAARKLAAAGAEGSAEGSGAANPPVDAPPKQRKPRKPRDPNAPPIQRKRKVPPTTADGPPDRDTRVFSTTSEPVRQPKITELASMRMDLDPPQRPLGLQHPHAVTQHQPLHYQQPQPISQPAPPKRETMPASMHSILNHDTPTPPPPPSQLSPPPPVRSSGQSYDPVRSSTYDPVRETMVTRDPYGTGPLGSPRAPTQMSNRASASPSIASLVDPTPAASTLRSPPIPSTQMYGRMSDTGSVPTSPSNAVRNVPPPAPTVPIVKPSSLPALGPATRPSPAAVLDLKENKAAQVANEVQAAKEVKETRDVKEVKAVAKEVEEVVKEVVKEVKEVKTRAPKEPKEPKAAKEPKEGKKPPAGQIAPVTKTTSKSADTSSATSAKGKASTAAVSSFKDVATTAPTPAPAPSKKVASMVLQERKAQKGNSASSSPKVTGAKDQLMPPIPDFPSEGNERSILDFGKANPADQKQAPSIVLHIPLLGETNKYVNFMRMAEEKYGWDALHPREAAHRDRKARIAAAASALEKSGSTRESGDEASDDDMSDVENSNVENGAGAGGGPGGGGGAGGTSGPDAPGGNGKKTTRKNRLDEYDKDDDFVDDSELLWEAQAAASKDGFFVFAGPLAQEPEKPAAADNPPKRGRGSRGGGRGGTTRGGASGRGSRGGPGSRGGATTRKPRITKLEKQQLDREKAEREKMAQQAAKAGPGNGYGLSSTPGQNPPFSAGMVIDL